MAWFLPNSRRLAVVFRTVGELLAHAEYERGNQETAVRMARRIIDVDPYDEAARSILIRFHARMNNWAMAVSEFREFREFLKREVGSEPSEELRKFVELGCVGPNQAKSFGRCGMGPCQGRMGGLTVTELIADARHVSPAEVGYYRIRPPIKPLTLGELAGE